MIRVDSHVYAGNFSHKEVDSELAFVATRLAVQLSKKPAEKGQYITRFSGDASGAYHLGRSDDALVLLGASCDSACAMFAAISAPPNTTVNFSCRGAQLSGPSGTAGFNSGPSAWLRATFVAAALGRKEALSALLPVPVSLLEKSPGERDKCFTHLAYAVQAFFEGEDVEAPIAEFRRLSEPAELKVASPTSLQPFRGLASALEAIVKREDQAFCAALVATLEGHRAVFGRGQEGQSHAYLIDYLASGLAVVARERGISVGVESAYMPRWLIEASSP